MKIIENNGDTTTAEDVCGQIQIQMENINNICGNEGRCIMMNLNHINNAKDILCRYNKVD